MGILEQWQITVDELNEIISANPSLRGFLLGYIAEHKLKRPLLADNRISQLVKYDNHDRARKGDISFFYQGVEISVEVKSLQTGSIRRTDTGYIGHFQCDASDRRRVVLPNGDEIETTCLLVGEFDLLAVNLFDFLGSWQFAFARNQDLPRSRYRRYKEEQRQYLLATLIEIHWPLSPPFREEPFSLLDEIVRKKPAI